jgi:hypothetical protein
MLESDSDVGYFDAFDSPEDMAKYAEVFKKQADVDAVAEKGAGGRNAWVSWAWAFLRKINISMLISMLISTRDVTTDRVHFWTECKCESTGHFSNRTVQQLTNRATVHEQIPPPMPSRKPEGEALQTMF